MSGNTVHFSQSVMSNSENTWTAARQASLSITNSRSLFKLMSIESVMPSNHLILCHPLLLLPSILPSIRVLSKESVLHIRWPKYWSFSFSISPSNEIFRTDFLYDWSPCSPRDSQESSPTPQFKSINSLALSFLYSPTPTFIHAAAAAKLLQSCSTLCDTIDGSPPGSPVPGILQARVLEWVAIAFSHPYMTTGKTRALTRWTFFDIVMSLLFNMLSRLVSTFLPRCKRHLISCLQSPSAVMVKSTTVSTVSPSIGHEVMGLDAMILVF